MESVKADSDSVLPVSGDVMEIKLRLDAAPSRSTQIPSARLGRSRSSADEPIGLLSPEGYAEIAQGEHCTGAPDAYIPYPGESGTCSSWSRIEHGGFLRKSRRVAPETLRLPPE